MVRRKPKVFLTEDDGSWQAQEIRVAKSLGAKRQRRSGALIYEQGDVEHSRFLIESKQTSKKSLVLKKSWLNKITHEAVANQKWPALSVEIQGDDDPLCERDWIMMPMSVFKRLLDE